MSEEILKALAQLYAIITKQDVGVSERERQHVITTLRRKLAHDTVNEYIALYDDFVGYGKSTAEAEDEEAKKLSSVRDSVRTLAICKKINKTLSQKQKIIVLVELFELICADKKLLEHRRQIIDTVADVFNVAQKDYELIQDITLYEDPLSIKNENIYVVDGQHLHGDGATHDSFDGFLLFMRLINEELYFVKYHGKDNHIVLNGLPLESGDVCLFSQGSTVKSAKGISLFYSDIIHHFRKEMNVVKISFNVKDVEYEFPNGTIGLRSINLSEGSGKLVGIMGPSGSGKTTLLNVLSGHEAPIKGKVVLNGINLHTQLDEVRGIIGYVSQDDLLIEELTVFENLYYSASLNMGNLTKNEIVAKVEKALDQLGLLTIKDLKVGSVLNKTISGGQRKRLNIALELIREPLVLFVDEPTSGLSSKDSENVMDLLKELTLRGKLIFVVIHQPSSDIYKMFDKLIIMDNGGYQIYYGNPMEAHSYFRRITGQANSDQGQCMTCGNVNPEVIFNIVEEKVVTEFGNFTDKRKISPLQWFEYFQKYFPVKHSGDISGKISNILSLPGTPRQWFIYLIRDLKNKLGNRAYVLINLLEAPVLALILAFIIRYRNDADATSYVYRNNDNIPAYLLMSIIVALFMGLSVSAEEIIRDKKIRKRETYLGLSKGSYLYSKLTILFSLSAFQTLLFVVIGNSILEIKGMYFNYWIILFSVACAANIMGLIASSVFQTAVAVYIVIPLLLIPQMILSGAMFSFDKLSQVISDRVQTPLLADAMISRWAYEALAVTQFKDNEYEKLIYNEEKIERIADDNMVYLFPELEERLEYIMEHRRDNRDSVKEKVAINLEVVRTELMSSYKMAGYLKEPLFYSELQADMFDERTYIAAREQIVRLRNVYQNAFEVSEKNLEKILAEIEENRGGLTQFKNMYFNEALYDLVRNQATPRRVILSQGKLVILVDPVYFNPTLKRSLKDYRSHF